MGAAEHERGHDARAVELLEGAMGQWRLLGESVEELLCLMRLVRLHLAAGDQEQVDASLARTVQLAGAGARDSGPEPPLAIRLLADMFARTGRHAEARAQYERSLAIERERGEPAAQAESLTGIARALAAGGDLQGALRRYEEALAIHESLRAGSRLEELAMGLADDSAGVYTEAIEVAMDLGRGRRAFDLSERARARAFLDHLEVLPGDGRTPRGAWLLRRERRLRASLERMAPPAEAPAGAREERAVRQQWGELVERLAEAQGAGGAMPAPSTLKLAQVRRLLRPDTTLLAYVVMPDRTCAFVVSSSAFAAVDLPVTEAALAAAVQGLGIEIGARQETREPRDLTCTPLMPRPAEGTLTLLHDQLIAPLERFVRTPRLGVIPHGILHHLPFASLERDGRRPGDRYTLFHLPSASLLKFLPRRPPSTRPQLLALGYSPTTGTPLPHAEEEATAIAELYGTRPWLGAEASAAAFLSQASRHTRLHLAAHGELNGSSPLLSRLLLASDDGSTGSLYLHDILDLDLSGVDLVVLSACKTSIGPWRRGDDRVALNRAFLQAGAATVIASLWSVEDRATCVLMTALHRHLCEGRSKAEALRLAQAETRARFPGLLSWAGFVLTGDPGDPA
jgi:CHAT domain-containing protein